MELKLNWDEITSLAQIMWMAESNHLSVKIDGDSETITVKQEAKT